MNPLFLLSLSIFLEQNESRFCVQEPFLYRRPLPVYIKKEVKKGKIVQALFRGLAHVSV